MDALQVEYGFVDELGMVFIPRSMQQQSNFKACENGFKTLIYYCVDNNYITVSFEKSLKVESKKRGRFIDELGRIIIPVWCRKNIRMSAKDILVISLIDSDTINIRTLATKENEPYKYDFYYIKPIEQENPLINTPSADENTETVTEELITSVTVQLD